VYSAVPVTFSKASTRGTSLPTYEYFFTLAPQFLSPQRIKKVELFAEMF